MKKNYTMISHYKLDRTDVLILDCLQKDAKMSISEIAQIVGMSSGAVDNRIEKLKERGIIQGFRVILNLNKLGEGVCFFFFLRRKKHSLENLESVEAQIRSVPEILQCYTLGGNHDFLIQILLPDISYYVECYERLSIVFKDIGLLDSYFVLDEIKQDGRIDLNHLQKRRKN